MYEAEARVVSAVLGTELVAIHHVGSTAIPGLAAKPTIDMLAEVHDIEAIDLHNWRFVGIGYTPMGEYGVSGRRYFFKSSGEKHTHHLHIFQEGHFEIERHLLFRDYLRSHPKEAEKYASLKISLAAEFSDDILSYMQGKYTIINEIDLKAKEWAHTATRSSTHTKKI
jgi:GrpB-like predicted nucleotidyltransferase (UPF0157 family)